MKRQHCCYNRRLRSRTSVTARSNALEGERFADADFAELVIAEEHGFWANKSVIMEGLDDGDMVTLAGVVDGRGKQRKKIVDVNNIRAERLNMRLNLLL